MNFENFVCLLSVMYTSKNNEERHAATTAVMDAESKMSYQDMLQTGVGLLRLSGHSTVVQAYGAVLLRRGLLSGRLTADLIPYADIMTWYLNEQTLDRLLCKHLIDLITECMVYEWPDNFPNLIELLCPFQEQLARYPRRISLLSALIIRFMDSHVSGVPVHLIKKLKRSMGNCSQMILVKVTQALFDMYTVAGGEGSRFFAEGTREAVLDCLSIVVSLVPTLSLSEWWQLELDKTMSVLVRWQPVAQEALAATASLFRCDVMSTAVVGPELSALLAAVLDSVGVCVVERRYGMLEEIADLLLNLPEPIVKSVVASVSRSCLAMLEIPSIYIGSIVCIILRRLGDEGFVHINPMELMRRLAALIPKNLFHPEFGIDGEGKQLSREQYGSNNSFEQGFAEFRSLVGHVLTSLVCVYPVVGNQFILHLFESLCDGSGTQEDPRTPAGFVTQQSGTFRLWEATQFLVEHISKSYTYSSEYISEAILALVEKQTDDMVLRPVYLNMLSTFWSCRDDVALGVWEGTLGIIFGYLEHKSNILNDIDVISARKRAFTLLVNACSQHSARIAYLSEPFIKRLEHLLMIPSTTQHERTLLYEAMAALTCALPAEEAQRRLQSFFSPIIRALIECVQNLDQKKFNDIVIAQNVSLLGKRDMLRNRTTIVAGVLRRCKTSPYLVESCTTMAPTILRLMEFVHSIRSEELPPAYACIVEMSSDCRQQYLPGVSRKSSPALNEKQKARAALMDLRMSLYQVVGGLSAFLPAETFCEMFQALQVSVNLLPIHVMRSLIIHCMFPLALSHSNFMVEVISTCILFFSYQASRVSVGLENEIIDVKQLYYLSKDVITFMRQHIIEKKLLEGNVELINLIVEVNLAIMECGANIHEPSRLIFTTLDTTKKNSGSELLKGNQIDELAVFAFGRMLDFLLSAGDATLSPKDKERLVFFLADMYVDCYPKYTGALVSRFSQADIDDLHSQLILSKRFDLKRRIFSEFLSKANINTTSRRQH